MKNQNKNKLNKKINLLLLLLSVTITKLFAPVQPGTKIVTPIQVQQREVQAKTSAVSSQAQNQAQKTFQAHLTSTQIEQPDLHKAILFLGGHRVTNGACSKVQSFNNEPNTTKTRFSFSFKNKSKKPVVIEIENLGRLNNLCLLEKTDKKLYKFVQDINCESFSKDNIGGTNWTLNRENYGTYFSKQNNFTKFLIPAESTLEVALNLNLNQKNINLRIYSCQNLYQDCKAIIRANTNILPRKYVLNIRKDIPGDKFTTFYLTWDPSEKKSLRPEKGPLNVSLSNPRPNTDSCYSKKYNIKDQQIVEIK